MSDQFREIDRSQPITLPGNLEGWRDGNDLAHFIVEVVEVLDTGAIEGEYRGGGSAPYRPKMLLALLFYCSAKGIFTSRQIERATYELIPVLAITGGPHPDHDSINTFRRRFLPQLEPLWVGILLIAQGLGVLTLGDVSLDSAKIQANASKHKAMSWAYAERLEQQLKAEVQTLLERAAAVEGPGAGDIDLPAEPQRREDRLAQIAEVKAEIERRAHTRYAQEQAAHTAKLAERAAQEQARGRKLGGKPPRAPTPGPGPDDQVNFTDGDSRKRVRTCRNREAGAPASPLLPQPSGVQRRVFAGGWQGARQRAILRARGLPAQTGQPDGSGDGFVRGAVVAHHPATDAQRVGGSGQRQSIAPHPAIEHFVADLTSLLPGPSVDIVRAELLIDPFNAVAPLANMRPSKHLGVKEGGKGRIPAQPRLHIHL